MADDDVTQPPPPMVRSGAREWTACRYADVLAVLADSRFEVPAAAPPGPAGPVVPPGPAAPPGPPGPAGSVVPVGTLSWLRASVSRFANGAEHRQRRALAVAELRLLDPGRLRRAAHQRAVAMMTAAARPGQRFDVMALLARRVPMTVMAVSLGITQPQEAADAAITIAAGYFPGSDPEAERQAGAATARLADLLSPAGADVIAARIALMVQGCDATGGLIGLALRLLQDTGQQCAAWPADAVLDQALWLTPVVRASRRTARVPAGVNGGPRVGAGDTVVCNIEAAHRDPAAPGHSAPGGAVPPILTFGSGLRPCPGRAQALALAAGVVEAVRDRGTFLPGQRVADESSPLRIPARLEVVLR
jgi:cytochrome P450